MDRPRAGLILIAGAALCVILAVVAFPPVSPSAGEVVIYTSVDREYAEPVLAVFENKTGIRVRAVYDVEAAKTTGLVNRLLAERGAPQADVFWSGEVVQTVLLAEQGALDVYRPAVADGLPSRYRDPGGRWTAFGGRVRVLLVDPQAVAGAACVDSVLDLVDGTVPVGRTAIALPLFGTSAAHAAALYGTLGEDGARTFFERLRDGGARVVDGNAAVRDLVAGGQVAVGLLDSDDASVALTRNPRLRIVVPDQEGMGAFVVPNTVGLVTGGPHPSTGRGLVDYLLSPGVEGQLVTAGWVHVPSRPDQPPPANLDLSHILAMNISYQECAAHHAQAQRDLGGFYLS
jgi:iron(III) transport system substrate-binding protein